MKEKRKVGARDVALEVLMQVDGANAWSDGSLKRTIAKHRLDSREAALATRLAYGVVQNKMLLDYYISYYCTKRRTNWKVSSAISCALAATRSSLWIRFLTMPPSTRRWK